MNRFCSCVYHWFFFLFFFFLWEDLAVPQNNLKGHPKRCRIRTAEVQMSYGLRAQDKSHIRVTGLWARFARNSVCFHSKMRSRYWNKKNICLSLWSFNNLQWTGPTGQMFSAWIAKSVQRNWMCQLFVWPWAICHLIKYLCELDEERLVRSGAHKASVQKVLLRGNFRTGKWHSKIVLTHTQVSPQVRQD